MKGINLTLALIIYALFSGTAGYSQVESIEMELDGSDPLMGKDPLLTSPLSGLESIQSLFLAPGKGDQHRYRPLHGKDHH